MPFSEIELPLSNGQITVTRGKISQAQMAADYVSSPGRTWLFTLQQYVECPDGRLQDSLTIRGLPGKLVQLAKLALDIRPT